MTNVQLELTAHVSGDALQVDYTVSNRGTRPLVCFDGAPGVGATFPDLTDAVYVSVLSGDEARLFRTPPQPPPGMTVAAIMIPPVSETAPGAARHVRFSIAVPVKERSQYTPDFAGAAYERHRVHEVSLVIECFWKTAGTFLTPYPASPGVFKLGGDSELSQWVRASARVEVDALARTDPAFFRMP